MKRQDTQTAERYSSLSMFCPVEGQRRNPSAGQSRHSGPETGGHHQQFVCAGTGKGVCICRQAVHSGVGKCVPGSRKLTALPNVDGRTEWTIKLSAILSEAPWTEPKNLLCTIAGPSSKSRDSFRLNPWTKLRRLW